MDYGFDHDRDASGALLLWFRIGVAAAFGLLALGFWNIQVGQHGRWSEVAENNHQRTVNVRAPRGVIFDRDGRVLVQNRHRLDIGLVQEQAPDLDGTLARLAAVTGTDARALRGVVESSDAPVYRTVVVVPDATLAQVAAVAARALEFPGVVFERNPARHYPGRTVAAHLFGYVGEATDSQIRAGDDERIRAGAMIGQSGVEHAYNRLLMGDDGARRIAVNSIGREIETLDESPPAEGRQLQLTIDLDVQQAAEEAFARAGFNGAAVALDPQSGEVLVLASLPGFDPNDFVAGIDASTWTALNDDSRKPLQNRALQGRYSPGSTFKVAMAAAALEEGVVTPDFRVDCKGGGTFYRRFFRCHARHGVVAMDEALEKSCNTYFYTLGSMTDIDAIHRWATALGLGVLTGVDLPHEVLGLMPSRAWKREARAERWYPGETISVSIGQGAVSVTPMSLAVMMATVANGGRRVTPHLLKATREQGRWVEAARPAPARVDLRPETVETIRRGLWMAVNGQGTARRARIPERDVIGKTGTAQVVSLQGRSAAAGAGQEVRDHGWFVFAAPRNDPEIAGVVFAEHGEHGYLAAPIAKHMIETYFAKQEGRPLPGLAPPVMPVVATAVAASGVRGAR